MADDNFGAPPGDAGASAVEPSTTRSPVTSASESSVVSGGRQASEQSRLKRMAALLAPGITLVFLISYGTLRPAHEFFYGQLGLSPEEVGLTEVVMLGRSITFAVVLLCLLAFLIAGLLIGYLIGSKVGVLTLRFYRWLEGQIRRSRALMAAIVILGVVISVLLIIALIDSILHGGPAAALDQISIDNWTGVARYALAATLLMFSTGLPVGLLSVTQFLPTFVRRISLRAMVGILSAIVVAWFVTGVLNFWDIATRGGEAIMAGEAPPDEFVSSASLWLQVHLQPVRVTSKSDPLGICQSGRYPVLVGDGRGDPTVLLVGDGQRSYLVHLPRSDYTLVRGVEEASLECGTDVRSLPR